MTTTLITPSAGSCQSLPTSAGTSRDSRDDAPVRCGAVRCGAVRCGAVRCGAVRCGAVRYGAVRCGAVLLSPAGGGGRAEVTRSAAAAGQRRGRRVMVSRSAAAVGTSLTPARPALAARPAGAVTRSMLPHPAPSRGRENIPADARRPSRAARTCHLAGAGRRRRRLPGRGRGGESHAHDPPAREI